MISETLPVVRQVSVNQCRTCMPLGAVLAFKGVEGAMAVVHGSQGCSTYMRLACTEHFNEPMDIASSSLNEKQTIYGGEANLRKALSNVMRVYKPKLIGITTTCLSETIGEDVASFAESYAREAPDVPLVPVSTPSYAGSMHDGHWAALRALVDRFAQPCDERDYVNIVLPSASPADVREIKRVVALMGLKATVLPDVSMTLDRPFGGQYTRIAPGGTTVEEISRMPGARCTIEFGRTCADAMSPGRLLEERYGTPLVRLPLPIGLDATDALVDALEELGGVMSDQLRTERGWLLDGMADSHKYNAEGRPVVFGDPETVLGLTSLLAENGSWPVAVASGTLSSTMDRLAAPLLSESDRACDIIDDADFLAIERAALRNGANIAIGHSGGKMLTERHGIPLVRIGFPINDRVGGQRIRATGYVGSLEFLDRYTNAILERKYGSYRQKRKDDFYREE